MNRPRSVEEICEWWKRIDEAAAKAPEVRAADGVIQASVRASLNMRQQRDKAIERAHQLQAEVERLTQRLKDVDVKDTDTL